MSERTRDGLAAARARGRTGGQKLKLTARQTTIALGMHDELGPEGRRAFTEQQTPRSSASPVPRSIATCKRGPAERSLSPASEKGHPPPSGGPMLLAGDTAAYLENVDPPMVTVCWRLGRTLRRNRYLLADRAAGLRRIWSVRYPSTVGGLAPGPTLGFSACVF